MKKLLQLPFDPKAEQEFAYQIKRTIWIVGLCFWGFGISDRSIAALADGVIGAIDLVQLLTAIPFALGWYVLKPQSSRD